MSKTASVSKLEAMETGGSYEIRIAQGDALDFLEATATRGHIDIIESVSADAALASHPQAGCERTVGGTGEIEGYMQRAQDLRRCGHDLRRSRHSVSRRARRARSKAPRQAPLRMRVWPAAADLNCGSTGASLASRGDPMIGPAPAAVPPRQVPARSSGDETATKSRPEAPNGWQRQRRARVIHPPAHRPKRSIASSA